MNRGKLKKMNNFKENEKNRKIAGAKRWKLQRMRNDARMSRELKERELIGKAKQGDKSALLALYEQYTPLLKKNYAVTGLIILMFWKMMNLLQRMLYSSKKCR